MGLARDLPWYLLKVAIHDSSRVVLEMTFLERPSVSTRQQILVSRQCVCEVTILHFYTLYKAAELRRFQRDHPCQFLLVFKNDATALFDFSTFTVGPLGVTG